MTIYEMERMDVLSFGKITAVVGLFFGLAMGVITLIITSMLTDFLQSAPVQAAIAAQNYVAYNPAIITQIQQLGFLGLILFLVSGIIIGFIVGAVLALIYNISAKLIGGARVQLKEMP